jgi:hypothetical protein
MSVIRCIPSIQFPALNKAPQSTVGGSVGCFSESPSGLSAALLPDVADVATALPSGRTDSSALRIVSPALGTDIPALRTDVPAVGTDCRSLGTDVPADGTDIPAHGTDVLSVGTDCFSVATEYFSARTDGNTAHRHLLAGSPTAGADAFSIRPVESAIYCKTNYLLTKLKYYGT